METYPDPECDRIFPMQFPAVLTVEMEDGAVYEERVSVNRGGPGNPLSDEELRMKFRINAERTVAADRAAALADAVDALGEAQGVGTLLELARGG